MAKDTIYNLGENAPVIGGIYKHYKGDLYKVLMITGHNDPDEPCVVYEAVHDNPAFPAYSRLLKSWNEEVEWNGEIVKRFAKVDNE